jgi:hypothetical protein
LLEVRAGVAKVLVADFECVLPKVFQFAALKVYDGKMNISKQSYLALIKTKYERASVPDEGDREMKERFIS